MAKKKIFDSSFSLPIDSTIKKKAMYILQTEHGKSITSFIREMIFNKVAEYEKKNGEISINQLSIFDEHN